MSAKQQTTSRRSNPRRPVVQYDRDGNRLAEFPSARAAYKATGAHFANICTCANRQPGHHTSGGFVWRWADDPEHLFREYRRTRDTAIRNRLVELNRGIVFDRASFMHAKLPPEVQLDDLVSSGMFGLMDAIERFEPERGPKFSTFCNRRVDGAMLDWLREQDWVPRLTRQRSKRITTAAGQLRAELGREPTREELAAHMGLADEDFRRVEGDTVVAVASLSQPMFEGDGVKDTLKIDGLIDAKAIDPAADPNHTALRDLLLRHFTITQALVLRLYYVDDLTMTEIGEALSLSESRISQLHKDLLRALRGRYGERLYELLSDGRAA